MRKWLLFTLFILLSQQRIKAQQPAFFLLGQDQFEGIDIYNVIQDFEHNYWFATDQGLYVHDGYTFTKVESDQMKAQSVFNFVIDSRGVIYCCNLSQQVFKIENGICSLIFEVPDNGTDLHLVVNKEDELYISTGKKAYILNPHHEMIHAPEIGNGLMLGPPFLLDNGTVIQHVSNQSKLLIYSNKSSHFQSIDYSNNDVKGDNVLHFFQLNKNTFCIDNFNKEIYKVNTKDFSTEKMTDKIALESELLRYYAIDNTLWVSNHVSGVFLWNDSLQRTDKASKIFGDYFISYVYKDHEGNILLSTFDQGVIVIPDKDVLDVDPQFANCDITRIINGAEEELYFGTRNGSILKYNGRLTTRSPQSNKGVEYLFYWPNHQLILEDSRNLTVHIPDEKPIYLGYGSLKDIAPTSANGLLLALNSGLLSVRFDPRKKTFQKDSFLLKERSYSVVQEENSTRTYVSTASGLRYKDDALHYELLSHQGKTIHVINLTAYKDEVFAASSKSGILVFQKGKVVRKITPTYNDIPLTLLKIIIEDNIIYANTQMGLFVINMEGEIINILNKSHGLTANKIIDFSLYENQLWVAHAKGIQYFDLSKINNKVSKPRLILKDVFINNVQVENAMYEGQFKSDERDLKFSFQVPTLRYREDIRYHFKLEGYLENWSINSYENHEVEYNALAPGSYRFIVKAENNGVFSEPVYYSFTISAPFYQRWWFIVLVLIAFVLLISAVYMHQLKKQRRKAEQINELNASRLTAIQSQMNPHFIFNSLNSIQDLVLKGDVYNSYEFITKFSNLVRRTLKYSDKDFIDFEQEISLIQLYLSLEKLRFKEDLEFTIDMNGIEDIRIPPMLIQPFIENALVHGLLHKSGKKQLIINFILEEVLVCEIIDNGIGREKAAEIKSRQGVHHESFAINAIKRRFTILKDHYEGQLGFMMEDIVSNNEVIGTKVILRIPIQSKY